jgi:hypothetical protein
MRSAHGRLDRVTQNKKYNSMISITYEMQALWLEKSPNKEMNPEICFTQEALPGYDSETQAPEK